jgi:PAS domain S-box-containing protein
LPTQETNPLAHRLDLATRRARIAIWEWDFEGDTLDWSPVFLEILGLDRSDFRGHLSDFMDRLVPEDHSRVAAALDDHLSSGTPYDIEYEMYRSDGQRVTIAATGEASLDASGRPIRMIGTVQDVTERRKLEQQLLRAERIANIGHWLLDLPSGTLVWSPELFRIHGLDPEGRQPSVEEAFGFYHPEDVDSIQEAFGRLMATGRVEALDVRLKLGDGRIRHVHVDGEATFGEDGAPRQLFGVVHDRTEMVQQAQQLQRSQRLETIGHLVGGVAHDFNNLLAVVEGNLDFLLEDLENRTIEVREQREIITNALSAARRGADLTRSLLAFARRSHLEPRTVDINDVVRETESWLGRALPVTIDRQTCLLEGGAVTTLDPTRLQSALVNIVVNARDAMADGGTLTILTERVEVGAGALDAGGGEIPPGDYLVLSVADTGAGIPPELLPRVFEPFVTSKEIGKGTGLGLSMVHGFVNQSGGFIRIRSQPGEGTTVELLFPASGESTAVPAAPPPGGESAAQAVAPARILVAEDQLGVLNVVVRTLTRAGYEVDAETDGGKALERFTSAPEAYDLLLTDVVMPGGMSGPELADACRGADPELKVIFMSGYVRDMAGGGGRLRETDVLLTKPVPRTELLEAVRSCLAGE